MENASKALLIAAAVLIAILIITIGIKIFSSSSDTSKVAVDTGKTINEKTGEATGVAISEITQKKEKTSVINYGNKTAETIGIGDDITIGSEKFMVIAKTSNKITAMPYYNIELKLDNPKQSKNAESTQFSQESYWGYTNDAIDMKNDNNLVQKYINQYEKTLKNIGAKNIITRTITKNEVINMNLNLRNPGKVQCFWIASSSSDRDVYVIKEDGTLGLCYYYFRDWFDGRQFGVRPIIEIST